MKSKLMIAAGILVLSLALTAPVWAQETPQEQPTTPVAQVTLTVEEAVMCTGVADRAPQGVPDLTAAATTAETTAATTAPTAATTTATTPAAATAPATTTPATATTAAAGGGEAPFPFAAGVGKLYCFTKISGATTTATVKHVWFFGETVVHTMELSLGGTPWRTWSNKTIPATWAGTGKVEIQDAAGAVLKTINFIVQ